MRSLDELNGSLLRALDGEIGRLSDFYFDDTTWVVRYLIADTGAWLPNKKALLTPAILGDLDWRNRVFSTTLMREQLEPGLEVDGRPYEPHLHSVRQVMGYHIQARDGGIGRVKDFIIDDKTWTIQYMVIDTGSWLPGKQILLAPSWVEQVNWAGAKVQVDLAQETIEHSPEYNSSTLLNREYETQLYEYYNRPKYWQ